MKSTLHLFSLVTALLLGSSNLAPGIVLIGEDFSGDDAVNLNGKTPSTLHSSLSGITWTTLDDASQTNAPPFDFERNGDIDASNNTAYLNIGSLINDAKGQSNGIFTISATFSAPPSGGSWYAFGFYTSATTTSGGNSDLEAGVLFRDAGDDADLEGWSDNDGNIVASDFATGVGGQAITVELDLTSWDDQTNNFGVITFSTGGTSAQHTLTKDFSWQEVGFGTSSGVSGTITNFELTQVPEPSAATLFLGVTGVLLLRRRRSLI